MNIKTKLGIGIISSLIILAGAFIFSTSSRESLKKETVQVAISFCDTNNPRTTAIWQDVLGCLKEQAFTVEWRNADSDIKQQQEDIAELMEYAPEYLVVMPIQTQGLEEELKEVDSKKTKIILLDRTIDNFKNIPILAEVRTDARWEGSACADILAGYFNQDAGHILEISGEKGSSINRMHSIGFRNQLSKYENLEIAGITEGNGDRGTARNNVINFFTSNSGKVQAIFANTDEEGIGAIEALEELGLRGTVPVVSVNGIEDVKNAMAAGGYLGCVEATPYLGENLLEVIHRDKEKQEVEYELLQRGTVYTSDNLDQMRGY